MASKKKKATTDKEPTPEQTGSGDVAELQAWAAGGGGTIPPKVEAVDQVGPKEFKLRYPTDMFGLANSLKDLAGIAEASRALKSLKPSEREEWAFKKLKSQAMDLASALKANKNLSDPKSHARLVRTIELAQKVHDGLRADYNKFMSGSWTRFQEITERVSRVSPSFVSGENGKEFDRLTTKFRAVLSDEKSTPLACAEAYLAVRVFLSKLEARAGSVEKGRRLNEEARSARIAVADDVLAAIERL